MDVGGGGAVRDGGVHGRRVLQLVAAATAEERAHGGGGDRLALVLRSTGTRPSLPGEAAEDEVGRDDGGRGG